MIMAPTFKQGERLMKNIFRFGLYAAAALSIFACSKVDEVQIPEEGYTHTTTIKVKKSITKTVINEGGVNASFKWSSDDASRFYLKENEVVGTGIAIASSDEYSTITITATFTTVSAPEYTYSGFLSKNKTGSNKPRVPATQTCTASSYDPNADILVAKSLTYATTQDNLEMQFARPVVVNKMTLKGLTAGETLSKVTISADKNFMGYYDPDPSSNTWTTDGDELVVNTNQVVPASGEVVIWFVTAPVEDATLTVVAETEDYTYSKTFGSTINFVQNQVTRFGVASLVKAAKVNYAGDYLIGSYYDGKWHLMSSTVNASNYYERTETSVTKTFASVAASDFTAAGISTNDYCWKVEADGTGYSIKSYNTNKYVSLTANSNNAYAADALDDDKYSTNFSFSVSGDYTTITSTRFDNRYLRYNTGYPRFAFYASSGSNICLIPCAYDSRTAVTLSFAENALNYDTSNYGTCTGQAVTASPNVSAITSNITYALTGDAIGTVNSSTGAVDLNGSTGSATITASFAGDGAYMPASVSYTVTVSAPSALSGLTATWSLTSGETTSLSAGSGNTSATLTTTNSDSNKVKGFSAGIASQKMSSDNYWLFTIPSVANVLSTTEVTIQFSGVKVNNNTYKGTYQLEYSWNGSDWTTTGSTYTETTSATSKSYTFTPGAKVSGTLYIRYRLTSGGGTGGGSHYLGSVTLSAE